MKKLSLIFLFILLAFGKINAQSDYNFTGYLENLQTVWIPKNSKQWIMMNSVTNRFDFAWYPNTDFTMNVSMRNIFDYGQYFQVVPGYASFITYDNGFMNLTKKIASNISYVFYTNIDRLNLLYSRGNFELQLGRQRINLGLNTVWTPNDIFNSSSYLNFDYVEKPGSDAIRLQYYTGVASSVEFAYKLNRNKQVTAAGIIKLNKWDYDFQLLGGMMKNDYVLGGGWSGQIGGAGFSGEMTYFRNKKKFVDTNGVFVAAISGNYTFSNSLFVQAEFLYNSAGKVGKAGGLNNLFSRTYSAKNLSPARYSVFGEVSYPITPLFRADISAIFNPGDHSFYIGPYVNISLTEDIYLLITGQFFVGDNNSEWGNYGQFYYLRLKWNF